MGIYRETLGVYSRCYWLRVRWSQTSFLKAERWWKPPRRVGKHRLKEKELFMFLRSSIQAGCGMWDVSWVKRDVSFGWCDDARGMPQKFSDTPNDPFFRKLNHSSLCIGIWRFGGLTFMIKTHHFSWPQVWFVNSSYLVRQPGLLGWSRFHVVGIATLAPHRIWDD